MKYEEFYFKMKYICLYYNYIHAYIIDLNTLVTSLIPPMYIIIIP